MPSHDKPAQGDDAVGYGKPPRRTQFKKGQSGNPAGRPKGTLNLATTLERALKQKVVVTEHGRRRTVRKFDVALMQLVNKAAAGEARPMALLLHLVQVLERQAETTTVPDQTLPEADRQVLTRLLNRLNRVAQGSSRHDEQ